MAAATIIYVDPTTGGSGRNIHGGMSAGFNLQSGTAAWPDATTSCTMAIKPGASKLVLSLVSPTAPTAATVVPASGETVFAPNCGAITNNSVTFTRTNTPAASGATIFNFALGSQ